MGKMEAAGESESLASLPNLQAGQVVLRELSTASQSVWIERLFARFSAMYGAAFGRQWDGADLQMVKTVWAEKLGGFNASQIADALKALEEKPYPPNLPEFLAICRSVSHKSAPIYRKDDPISPMVAEKIHDVAIRISESEKKDSKSWAREIRGMYIKGDRLNAMQIDMASEALGESWENRKCYPRKAA